LQIDPSGILLPRKENLSYSHFIPSGRWLFKRQSAPRAIIPYTQNHSRRIKAATK
jgi:hypothetical protein